MSEHKIYLHPIPVRIWHWIHAAGIVLLVLTGVQLRFPGLVHLFGGFKNAVNFHNFCGFMVLADYILWIAFYLVTGKLFKIYVPTPKDIKEGLPQQAAFYLYKYFKGEPAPFSPSPDAKFNALQKVAYFFIMLVLLPIQIATGVMLYNIKEFKPFMDAIGGVQVIDAIHILLAYCFAAFLMVHVYLCTLGHTFWDHFKAMILGYEEAHH